MYCTIYSSISDYSLDSVTIHLYPHQQAPIQMPLPTQLTSPLPPFPLIQNISIDDSADTTQSDSGPRQIPVYKPNLNNLGPYGFHHIRMSGSAGHIPKTWEPACDHLYDLRREERLRRILIW
ncbi:hypothetical protein PM082_021955 [Marasmius tenuissimus]|nr:hypothetical protein PM082_021955 [Marasmius tenuissimus]